MNIIHRYSSLFKYKEVKLLKHKAVILGNNYYIGLSAMRCLGSQGVHTVAIDYDSNDRYAVRSKYCNESHIAPHYQKNTAEFIDFLVDYAKKQEEKPVLLPCHDAYVEVIDNHQHILKDYYLMPSIKQGLLKQLMDKDTLYQIAEKHGVKFPETIYITENMADEDIQQQVENTMKFPCIIKPVNSPEFVSVFRRKVFIVENMEDLLDKISQTRAENLEVFVQRIIPGFDDHMHTFNAYLNEDAKVTHWTTCQKQRQYPVNFGASVYTVQKHFPELYEIGKEFLEGIGFKGIVEIEFKKDADTGDFYLIELNVRVTNFNQMLYKIGLNLPFILYSEVIGNPVEPYHISKNTNTAFMYGFEDMLAIKDYIKTKQLKPFAIIKSYFRPKAYAIWKWNDMKPFFAFNLILSKKVLRKLKIIS